MLTSLLRFEMQYHFKQITFQVAAILFFGLGVFIPLSGFGGSEIFKNGPFVINFIICLLSIFMTLVSAVFCSNVVLRDKFHQIYALIFSSGMSKSVYLGVKLTGLFLSVLLIMCMAVLGILAGTALIPSNQKGSFEMLYYLQPLLSFGLPNTLICSCLIFAAAIWTQAARAVYVSAVLLFMCYFIASIFGNSTLMATSALKSGDTGLVATLADPFGLSTFFRETKSWPVWRKNHETFPLQGAFLVNRLLWTGIGLGLLILCYSRFRFGLVSQRQVLKSKTGTREATMTTYRCVPTKPLGSLYFCSVLGSQVRLECTSLFKGIHFLVLLALWMFVNWVVLHENLFYSQYTIRFYPTSALVIEQLISVRLAILLLVFYASELIHREHATKIQPLVVSTPLPNGILFLAKTGALAALIAVLISANIITGIAMQWMNGYQNIALLAYLSLYYYSGFQLLLLTVLIVFIQSIIPNKYLGMMVSLGIIGLSIFGELLGVDEYLLRFGAAPSLVYSSINQFGHYANAFNGYMFFWAILSFLLSLLTSRWWPNGTHDTVWLRIKAGLKSWNRVWKFAAISSLLLLCSTGFYINQKSKGIDPRETRKKDIGWQKRYEQKYKSTLAMSQPVITAVKLTTNLYPDKNKYSVSGMYTIKNESSSAISKLWIGAHPAVRVVHLHISGAVLKIRDEDFNQYFYELKNPLLPGTEMAVTFSLQVERSGFLNFDSENSIVSNGSYIALERFLPFFGYHDRFELSDPEIRKKNGLAPQSILAENDHRYHFVNVDNTISTHSDQQVVSVGTLQKTWRKGDRSYFRYKTEQPIPFRFAVSSARYAVKTEVYKGTTFRILYHPGQTQNLQALMQAMKDGVSYGSKQFSQYPLNQLTLAEIPAYRGTATAYPGVIFSSEKFNFLVDASDTSRLNYVYATTVHQTAHQWWAYQVVPQTGPGYAFLTESLAKYTEAMVVEKHFGKMRLSKNLQMDNSLYFTLRNNSGKKELPLNQTWKQPFVDYQKGGLAMYTLKELLGETRVNRALKRLILKNGFPKNKPSSDDLIKELNQNVTPFERNMIENLLKKVIIYDNSIKILSIKDIGNGRFKIQLLVSVPKTDETGLMSKKLKSNELIDIAFFDTEQLSWNERTKPIYFKKFHIIKSQTVIEIVIDKMPKVVALDPYRYLLDSDHKNNILTF
jgi:hypothetical protein